MVLLFLRKDDDSGDRIIRWLRYLNCDFVRINAYDELKINYDLSKHTGVLQIRDRAFKLSAIKGVYYNNTLLRYRGQHSENKQLDNAINANISNEYYHALSHILGSSAGIFVIGLSPFNERKINKLDVLKTAELCGWAIPPTAIISNKSVLLSFINNWGEVVTKNIDNGVYINTDTYMVSGQKTELIEGKHIELLGEFFAPSLVQQRIHKLFEIRSFYLYGTIRSIAIFSQGESSTQVDFRNYTPDQESRMVPFELPDGEQQKLFRLMNSMKLNYGSIDLIYSTNKEYIFLEVNPYGQYGFLSYFGNFQLEKYIAEKLNESSH